MEKSPVPLAVLISGRGSNLQAIIQAIRGGRLRARIAVVISNRADAPGLSLAQAADIETRVMPHGDYPSRDAFDAALADAIKSREAKIVCLAGFMRRLGPAFCAAFPNAILNVHPALLPAFPGAHAQRQAFDHGVTVSGVTVHFVTPDLDAGPIVMQAAVPVLDGDTAESLADRILTVEHEIYPRAIQRVLDGGWKVDGRRVMFS
ncbi:MAG TPA: phosphoribosylglycinamide formyltransferase [Vicinamibacterales bacterium]|nr:phosphoribosylglycinamide formyltransferase [Vicinamibacterales bacterium]